MYNDYALFEVQLINSRPFEPTIYFLHIRTHFFNCESLYVDKNISKSDGDSF